MSHVAEGALHAYLDGALDELPAAEAEWIRAHIESCAECAERLEAERSIRSDAHAILGLAAPDVEMPSLEELRAYVKRTRPERPALTRMTRLGWAASIMVALGTGWMLRDGQLTAPGAARAGDEAPLGAEIRAEASDLANVVEGAAERELASEESGAPARFADRDDLPSEVVAKAREGEAAEETSAGSGAAAGRVAEPVAFATPGAPAETPPAAADAMPTDEVARAELERQSALRTLPEAVTLPTAVIGAREAAARPRADGAANLLDSVAPVAGSVALTAPAPQASPPADSAASPEQRAARRRAESLVPVTSAMDQSAVSAFRGVSEDARVSEEAALAVPGVEVVSVTNLGQGTVSIGVQVVQRRADGVPFDIFHLEPGVDPGVLPAADEGVAEVRLETESGWVVIRGELQEHELEELMGSLFPGR